MKSLVKLLKITLAQEDKETLNEEINNKLFDHIMGGIESVSGKFGHYYIGVRSFFRVEYIYLIYL
jgi:hypothetical protein